MQVYRTFIADDHLLFRVGISQLLEQSEGFELAGQFTNGVDLMDQLRTEPVDLLIIDHDMPGLSGLDVTAWLRKENRATKVVVLTGLSEPQLMMDYAELKPDGMVLKSDDGDSLKACLAAIKRDETYVSDEIAELLSKASATDALTSRERQVIRHVAKGLSNKEVARAMGIAPKTVDNHRTNVMQKLDLHNTAELVSFAVKSGLA